MPERADVLGFIAADLSLLASLRRADFAGAGLGAAAACGAGRASSCTAGPWNKNRRGPSEGSAFTSAAKLS